MNQLKTAILMAAMTGLLLFLGHLIGGTHGVIVAFALSVLMNLGTYFFSDKIVLAMYRAAPVGPDTRLYRIVQRLADRAGLPMPRVYLIPSPTPNAFATGRSPNHAAVAATEGILRILDDDEMEAVMAHELAHVRNRDILISAVVATIAGAISMIANLAYYAALFGGLGRQDEEEEGSAAELIGALLMVIFAPFIAMLLQLAISRAREYHADEVGASIHGDPLVLARALQKIHAGVSAHPMAPSPAHEATAHLFIENPFRVQGLVTLFSTHPPVEDRVARLRRMAESMTVPRG